MDVQYAVINLTTTMTNSLKKYTSVNWVFYLWQKKENTTPSNKSISQHTSSVTHMFGEKKHAMVCRGLL
jgi:hypothetical protein